ncbi:DUF3124 domain-containing protein [Winogradskyella psychrotolerans]|uniref:DUF3124 domain-containing protein n=1 Tax=Winogradskyella psychrotolerans TaxID=1344585 RepID=UPI001C07828F|nr:DUF3124 domain-containing protein [Winogradskyella psychrotolerans]MBU2928582.1 DUF3124 domain-containing protein [Winogradskyella psychrotolerans]
MKRIVVLFIVLFGFYSCNETVGNDEHEKVNWNARKTTVKSTDSLVSGKSYLSVYSQIYSYSQHKTYNLTAMISIRNTSDKDSMYLSQVNYYDTHGSLLKAYINNPVYLTPMETIDIVINEVDIAGGTGGNFIFNWETPQDSPEPIFEGVMTSTSGQQGLSFLTHAKRID